ncbi:hypothetical protein GQ457_07G015530 [Hibiscus cannabinus]
MITFFVYDMVSYRGKWNWSLLHRLLIPTTIPFFFNIHCPDSIVGADRLFWKHGKHSHFSTKSAYAKLCEPDWEPHNVKWLLIWRLSVPEHIMHFLWLLVHDKLFSNLSRYHWSFTEDRSCSVCGVSEQSSLHVLCDFSATKDLWTTILQRQQTASFFSFVIEDWILPNIQSNFLYSKNRHTMEDFVRLDHLTVLVTS